MYAEVHFYDFTKSPADVLELKAFLSCCQDGSFCNRLQLDAHLLKSGCHPLPRGETAVLSTVRFRQDSLRSLSPPVRSINLGLLRWKRQFLETLSQFATRTAIDCITEPTICRLYS